ncbi:hypothetical protein SAMN02799616_04665 [Paenibacillus sp. UNC499MF]|nr:hypothetical protein SAMN02799616_04665 [Paenibacillus sp. UNC499MF]
MTGAVQCRRSWDRAARASDGAPDTESPGLLPGLFRVAAQQEQKAGPFVGPAFCSVCCGGAAVLRAQREAASRRAPSGHGEQGCCRAGVRGASRTQPGSEKQACAIRARRARRLPRGSARRFAYVTGKREAGMRHPGNGERGRCCRGSARCFSGAAGSGRQACAIRATASGAAAAAGVHGALRAQQEAGGRRAPSGHGRKALLLRSARPSRQKLSAPYRFHSSIFLRNSWGEQ